MKLRTYNIDTALRLPVARRFDAQTLFDMRVVAAVLPFRVNNYVVEKLINWDNVPHDPIFQLTFPQKGMLCDDQYERIARLMRDDASRGALLEAAKRIRLELDPDPTGQKARDIPAFNQQRLAGVEHRYDETVVVSPREGRSCHSYCNYCFRWSQFLGEPELRLSASEPQLLSQYLVQHSEVNDVLFSGGDPLVMHGRLLARYVDAILAANPPHVHSLSFETKALAYWPYRFLQGEDAESLFSLFRRVMDAGRQVTIIAHFDHQVELSTSEVRQAIERLQATGCEIRTQAPCARHVNDDPAVWAEMLEQQLALGLRPHRMLVIRNSGAQHYFSTTLGYVLQVYRATIKRLGRRVPTMAGPLLSTSLGELELLDAAEMLGERVFSLRFLQARDASWVGRVFHAGYNAEATWLSDLRPAFGSERFFFEQETLLDGGVGQAAGTKLYLVGDRS